MFRDAPRILSKEIIFSYLEGANFVNALRAEFGWLAVNLAYLDPPESTEQILDPAKYIDRRDRPVKIEIAPPPEGMKAIVDDTLGMLGIRVLFQEAGVHPSDAAGWDGDRYALWEKDGHEVLAWVSAWDSEAEAKQFAVACGRLFTRRHGSKGFAMERIIDHVAVVAGLPCAEARVMTDRLLKETTFERAPNDEQPESLWSKVIRFPLSVRRLDRVSELSLFGGIALEVRDHDDGHKWTLAHGVVARTENNPDRTLLSLICGLFSISIDRTQQYGRGGLDLVIDFQHHGPQGDGRWELDLLLKSLSVRSSRAHSGIELLWGAFEFKWGEQVPDGEHIRLFFIPVGW